MYIYCDHIFMYSWTRSSRSCCCPRTSPPTYTRRWKKTVFFLVHEPKTVQRPKKQFTFFLNRKKKSCIGFFTWTGQTFDRWSNGWRLCDFLWRREGDGREATGARGSWSAPAGQRRCQFDHWSMEPVWPLLKSQFDHWSKGPGFSYLYNIRNKIISWKYVIH